MSERLLLTIGASLAAALCFVVLTAPGARADVTVAGQEGPRQLSSTSITLGAPAGVVAGDVLIAQVMHRSNITVVPSGWTLIRKDKGASYDQWSSLYEREATAGDAGSPSWSWTQADPGRMLGGIVRVRGVEASPMVNASVGASCGSCGTISGSPAVVHLAVAPATVAEGDSPVLLFASQANWFGGYWGGSGTRLWGAEADEGNSRVAARWVTAAAGSLTGQELTFTDTAAGTDAAVQAVVLNPVAPPPPTPTPTPTPTDEPAGMSCDPYCSVRLVGWDQQGLDEAGLLMAPAIHTMTVAAVLIVLLLAALVAQAVRK